MTDQEIRTLLGAEVPGEEAALEEVRARVLRRLPHKRPAPLAWGAALAAIAAVVLLLVLRVERQPASTLTLSVPPPAAPAVSAPTRIQAVNARPRRSRVRKAQPAPVIEVPAVKTEEEPIVVKLVTDDPDVVILWFGD